MKRIASFIAIGAFALALTSAFAAEEKTPDATLKLSGGSVAAGIGFSWGKWHPLLQGQGVSHRCEGPLRR